METELTALEDRIGQLVALGRRLRDENAALRQSLLTAQNEVKALQTKVDSASVRVQRLLDSLPEEAA
jgi:uncharacterized protein YlxW (UPF0749 family)